MSRSTVVLPESGFPHTMSEHSPSGNARRHSSSAQPRTSLANRIFSDEMSFRVEILPHCSTAVPQNPTRCPPGSVM